MGGAALKALRIHQVIERSKPKQSPDRLYELIKPKLDELNNIPRINGGGCAIVALALAKYIRKLGYKPKIIYLFSYWSDDEYDEISNNIPSTCSHAVVRVMDKYFDSTGVYTLDELSSTRDITYKSTLTDKFAKETLECSDWNTWFNKEKYEPKIHEILR